MKKISFGLTKRNALLLALLVLVGAGAGAFHYLEHGLLDKVSAQDLNQKAGTPVPAKSPIDAQREQLQNEGRRILEEAKSPVAPSPWIEADKKHYRDLLAVAHPSIVVVPFQIESGANGIDASARMVMTYLTAQRIASGNDLKVADAEFAARALGEPRHLSKSEAMQFGRAVGAKKVVYGETSHAGHGHLKVSVYAFTLPEPPQTLSMDARSLPVGPPTETKSWAKSEIEISNQITPELAYAKLVDDAVQQIGFADSKPLVTGVYAAANKLLAENPVVAMKEGAGNPADGIWMQELLGTLFPEDPIPAGARVFERALAGTEYLAPGSADYKLLRARALARLGRRPAALAMIGDSAKTPEEQAFIAFLNGNVPEMGKAIMQIKRPIPKLIAEIERASTEAVYDQDLDKLNKTAERIAKMAPKEWGPVIIWYLTSLNLWNTSQTMPVKLVMDAHFPIKGYSAEDVMRSKMAMSSRDSKVMLEIEGVPLTHAAKVIDQSGADWCCETQSWKPTPHQYLNLLAASTEGMLIRNVDHVSYIQGQNDQAMQMADMIDEVVFQQGNPALNLRKARLLGTAISRTQSPEARAALWERFFETAKRARQWNTRSQASSAELAENEARAGEEHYLATFKHPTGVNYPNVDDFKNDFPPEFMAITKSPEYAAAASNWTKDLSPLETACVYVVSWPRPCETWRNSLELSGQGEVARRVEKEQLADRFHGNSLRVGFLVAVLKKRGDLNGATTLVKESIKLRPDAWDGYRDLGNIHLEDGNFKAAAAAYLSYPTFKGNIPDQANTVGISVDSEDAANALARAGAIEQARPLYQVAARYRNGSGASLSAMTKLAFFDRRFGDAEQIGRERVEHYGDGLSIMLYASLLFALGDSQNAWAGIQETIKRKSDYDPWRSVEVGFRLDGADVNAVRKWVKENAVVDPNTPPTQNNHTLRAMIVATMALAMDRPPVFVEALPGISKELFPPQVYFRSFVNLDQVPPDRREQIKQQMEKAKAEAEKKAAEYERLRPRRFNDQLDRLISGYIALKRGDYSASWDAFEQYRDPPFNEAEPTYTGLPYHAIAAVKAGKVEEFRKYLELVKKPMPLPPNNMTPRAFPNFDIHLAQAILLASQNKHDDAKRELLRARGVFPATGFRPILPEYVFAEVCELIAANSGVHDYLNIAVEWAKSWQIYQPWLSWPYVFEAKYGKNDADRVRALAIAQYLDRNSERIAGIDVKIANRAKAWLAANKPFPRTRRAEIERKS